MKTMGLTSAYGREYKSKKAIEEDFHAGKDFLVNDFSNPWDGKPVNKSQLVDEGYTHVNVRYARNTKVTRFEVE